MPARQPGNAPYQPIGNPRSYRVPSGFARGLGDGPRRPSGSALRTAMRKRALTANAGGASTGVRGSPNRGSGPTYRARLKPSTGLANIQPANAGRNRAPRKSGVDRKSTIASMRRRYP